MLRGMEAFLREVADHCHIDHFQSLEKFHELGLPCKLPACLKEALKSNPGIVELKNEIQALIQEEGASSALHQEKS